MLGFLKDTIDEIKWQLNGRPIDAATLIKIEGDDLKGVDMSNVSIKNANFTSDRLYNKSSK